MAPRWRQIVRKFLHIGRRVIPAFISAGLVAWLIWSITPQKLLAALSVGVWPWLLLATFVQLVVLFLWDTMSMWWLFSQPDRHLPFPAVLRARTDSVIWSAVNLEIGQGMFAWTLAEEFGLPVPATLGRCLLLGLFDFSTLQCLALLGSFLTRDPVLDVLRWVPIVSVSGLFLLVLASRFLPADWRRWLGEWDWTSWLAWWNWRHSFWLALQRLILFLLVLVYAGVCLAICHLPANPRLVVSVIPFVLVAESLPGTGGLGERETALVYLLRPESDAQRAMLLSFGLIWSTVVILGRVVIGLVSRALPRRWGRVEPSKAYGLGEPAA